MIIQTKNIQVESNQETDDFEINNEDGHLYSVLSELYSDPIGSTCREIASNCNDAHQMNNNEERPFIIKLPNPEKNINEIAFRDFGPGLTDGQVKNIYKVYGVSTKNKLKNVTGCLGLGSKSPYSLSSTFYVKSYLNGKVYLYTCAQNNEGKPNITKYPTIMDTDEENGLEVIIPLYQQVNFQNVLTKVLKYFKVKPLVYKQMDNLTDDELVNIEWPKIDDVVKLTDTIYVNPALLKQQSYMNNKLTKVKSEVIQLQIYYAIDNDMISHAIDRFNRAFIKISGEVNNKFKISDSRKKIIMFLLDYGIKFYSEPGKIAFSPSRENIKYTDYTLEYLIIELNRAAKIIERVIFKNFKNVSGDFETFYDSLILNYENYTTYLEFCSKFDIDTKIAKRYEEFNNMIYNVKPKLNYILGEFSKSKDIYKEFELHNEFKTLNIDNHSKIRELHRDIKNKKIIVMDLFTKDILKKIPNINSNAKILVTSLMSDAFKNQVFSLLEELLNNIETEVKKNSLEYFDIVHNEYVAGKLNYKEFINVSDFRKIGYDLKFDNTTEDNGLSLVKDSINEYIIDKFKLIKKGTEVIYDSHENSGISNLNNDFKELPYIALANYEYSLVKVYQSVYKLLGYIKDSNKFNMTTFRFYYNLGKLLNYYDARKTKIKSVFNLSLYGTFNIGKMSRVINLNDKDTYVDDKHIHKYREDFYENQDPIFKDFGILKYKNNLLMYIMVYLVKKLIVESPNLIQEQLSLVNYDLTNLIRKDLKQFNVLNIDTKPITEIKVVQNKIITVKAKKATFRDIKNLSINNSEFILIDYTEEECLEIYDYMKMVIRQFLKFAIVNDTIDSVVRSIPMKSFSFIDKKVLYPTEFSNNQGTLYINQEEIESDKLLVNFRYNGNAPLFMYKNDSNRDSVLYPSLDNNIDWYERIVSWLNEDFSIASYNKLFGYFVDRIGYFPTTGIAKFDNYLDILKKYTKKGSIPFGNSLIHPLPENYNFEPVFINLSLSKENYTSTGDTIQIDSIHFGKIVDILNKKKNLLYPIKVSPKLESKTIKDISTYNKEFEYSIDNINLKETVNNHGFTFKVLKELIPSIGYNSFNDLVEEYNIKNNENYICLQSSSVYSNFIKKSTYNFYQFSLIIMREFLKRYISSDYKIFDMEDKMETEKLIFRNDDKKLYNQSVLNNKFKLYNGRTSEQKNIISSFLNLEHNINLKTNNLADVTDNKTFDFILVCIQLRIDYDMYSKIFMNRIPNELLGNKLLKEFRNSFNSIIKIKIKTYRDIFGDNFVNKIISFDFTNLLKSVSDKCEHGNNYLDRVTNEFFRLFNKQFAQEINMLSNFRTLKSVFNKYLNLLHISRVIVEVSSYKIDPLRNFDMDKLKIFDFLGELSHDIESKRIERKTVSKIYSFGKYGKFINFPEDNSLKNDVKFFNVALKKDNAKELIKSFFTRKVMHHKINTRTIIENKKNKDLKIKILPSKKYYPM